MNLFIVFIREIVGDNIILPDHILDGRLPDGPRSLAIGVKAAVPDLASTTPPGAKTTPFVGVKT